jgi:hypothetical protein
MNDNYTIALQYLSKGWSVIPIGDDKKPLIRWEEYQRRLPTEEEIRAWWSQWPNANIGIVTGAISKLVVVDIEKDGNCEGLTPTVISRTGGGGFHYYYQHPGGVIKNSVKNLADKVDIRGDGGYAVAPPSMHKTGNRYEWEVGPDDVDLAPLPDEIIKRIKELDKKHTSHKQFSYGKINNEGIRNEAAASICGKILSNFAFERWESEAWPAFKQWNELKNNPPLDERELRSVFDSIGQREAKKNQDGDLNPEDAKQSQVLADYVKNNCGLFTFNGEPYAIIPVRNHKENHPLNSSAFKGWLFTNGRHKILGKIPGSNSVKEAISYLQGFVGEQNIKINLCNRTAKDSHGNYWLDMSDDDWRAIKINKEGWSVVSEPPTMFRRYEEHQISMVEPDRQAGDITLLEKYLNIKNKQYIILIYATLVTSILEDITVPCLTLHGQQGSAKTTIFRLLRQIVDPSCLGVIDFNEIKAQLAQTFDHHKVNYFDNLSGLKRTQSDILAKVITGSGFTQRMLYQNDSDLVRNIKKVIGLNGINMVIVMPDLLERSIVIETELIEEKNRKTDSDINEEFKSDLPKILGGLLNLTVEVLKNLALVDKSALPRMADYALHGEAMSMAMGYKEKHFLAIYNRNIAETNQIGVDANQLAGAILAFIDHTPGHHWEGSIKNFLAEVTDIEYETIEVKDVRDKYWPKNAAEMGRRLRELEPILRREGITLTHYRTAFQRNVIIQKNDKMTDDGNDSKNMPEVEYVDEETQPTLEGIEF